MRPDQSRVESALAYGRRGWAVFPCHSPAPHGGGCSCCRSDCSSPAKHPRIAGGLKAATTDPDTIRAWWRRWPSANIGIRTGTANGLVVVDVDPPHGGDESMAQLVKHHGVLPKGLSVETGSGGRHFYFEHPGGTIRNDAGRRLGPGIDVRGDGGYVIAPPSRHVSGAVYVWTSRSRQLSAAPAWMLERLRQRDPPRPPAPSRTRRPAVAGDAGAWARAALEGELAAVQRAVEGTRNHTLNRAAFNLGQIVASGSLDSGRVASLLVESATSIGLSTSEAEATVASGMTAGSSFPRRPSQQPTDLDGPRGMTSEVGKGLAVDLRVVDLDIHDRGTEIAVMDIPQGL